MTHEAKKISKFLLLLLSCLMLRLMPFRAPNVEPITAALLPISGVYGRITSALFGILSVLIYDTVTGTLGTHTFFTAGAFGMVGIGAGSYFSNKNPNTFSFIKLAVGSTLFFDAVTGLIPGPLFYGQPFAAALYGQIPFTMLHLLGNVVFASTLSPFIYHLLIKKRKSLPEPDRLATLNPKII